jgi:hypothetical protein
MLIARGLKAKDRTLNPEPFLKALCRKKSIAESLLNRYDGRQIDFFLELILTNIGKNENGRETEDFGD